MKKINSILLVLILMFSPVITATEIKEPKIIDGGFNGFELINTKTGTQENINELIIDGVLEITNNSDASYQLIKKIDNLKGEYLFEADIKLDPAQIFRTMFYIDNSSYQNLVAIMSNDFGKLLNKDGYNLIEPEIDLPENKYFNLKSKVNTINNTHNYYYNNELQNGEQLSFNENTDGSSGIGRLLIEIPKKTSMSIKNFKIVDLNNTNSSVNSDAYVVDNKYKLITNVAMGTTRTEFLNSIKSEYNMTIVGGNSDVLLPGDKLNIGNIEWYNISLNTGDILPTKNNEKNTIYVSNSGSDENNGSIESPFLTIQKAVTVATPNTVIYIRGGDYRISETIKIKNKSNIKMESYNNEKVRILGGREIKSSDFKILEDTNVLNRLQKGLEGKIYEADLKKLDVFDYGEFAQVGHEYKVEVAPIEVFCNNKVMTLARYPNDDYLLTGEIVRVGSDRFFNTGDVGAIFSMTDTRPLSWEETGDIWMNGFWAMDYAQHDLRLNKIDKQNQTIEADPILWNAMKAGRRYYFYNILEELDVQGEWFVDREKGKLYFYPIDDIGNCDVMVSTLEDDILDIVDSDNVVIKGIEFCATRGNGINIIGGHNNTLDTLKMWGMGVTAVNLLGGYKNGVANCDISKMGYDGVYIRGGDRRSLTRGEHYVKNSSIYTVARRKTCYANPINVGGVGNSILNNEFYDCPHSAIYFHGNDHLIQGNEIYNVCKITNDIGSIYSYDNYSWWGTQIKYNYMHDLYTASKNTAEGVPTAGVYLDNFTSGVLVEGNIFERVDLPIFQHGGRYNTYKNNLFIDSPYSANLSSCGARPPIFALWNVPYKSQLWQKKYPKMYKILEETPTRPVGDIAFGNISNESIPIELHGEETKKLLKVYDNIHVENNFFSDKENRDFSIADRTVLNDSNSQMIISTKEIGSQGRKANFLDVDETIDDKEVDTTYVNVVMSGKEVTFENTPFMLKGSVMMPLVETSKILELEIIKTDKQVTIKKRNNKIVLELNNNVGSVNGVLKEFWIGVIEKDGVLYLSNDVLEQFNAVSNYYEPTKTINFNINNNAQPLDVAYVPENSRLQKINSMLYNTSGWNTSGVSVQTINEDKLVFSQGSSGIMGYGGKKYQNEIINFNGILDLKNWQGMGIRSQKVGVLPWDSNDMYLLVLKSGSFEIQKWKNGTNEYLFQSSVVPFLKVGKVQNIQFGAVDTKDGVNIILNVDGEAVVNVMDTNDPITSSGYVNFLSFGNANFELQSIKYKKNEKK